MKLHVHKVVSKTAQLAKQNLFRAFSTKPLSSNNNYSTLVKKENFISTPTQPNNTKLMNIFVTDFKNYSSSSVNTNNNTTQVLNLVEFEGWSKEVVCSLLCSPKKNGGAGLAIEKVKPLYDAGFDGASLANIIDDLLKKEDSNTVDECWKSFPNVSRDTIKTVVGWVATDLKLRIILAEIPSSFNNSILLWNAKIEETTNNQKRLLQSFFKTPILPTHYAHFNELDLNLYTFAWDTFSIPKDKVKQFQKAIDESQSVGRGISDKTLIALADLSGLGKTHAVFNLSHCKPKNAERYLVVFTTKDSLIYQKFNFTTIDPEICASIYAYSNLLLIQTLLEHSTSMNGLDFLRYMRDGGDDMGCKIYEHICKSNPVEHMKKCQELLKMLESKYRVKIVFVFDEASQLIPVRINTVQLSTDKANEKTGSMLHAIYKQFLFVNTVYIDTGLSIVYLLDKISGEGRESLRIIMGTIKPWYFSDVSSMLLHLFKLPSNGETEYTGNFKREFWLLSYLLIGVPEKSVTFFRMVLNWLKENPTKVLSEKCLFDIFFESISTLTSNRFAKATKRYETKIKTRELQDLLLSLILDLPITASKNQLSFEPKEKLDIVTELKISLVDKSIAPVEMKNDEYHFHIIDPIDYLAYSSTAFKNVPDQIWEKVSTMFGVGVKFEYMMILLLMHESERLMGRSIRNSPLFADLNEEYEDYQLSVKGFIKDKTLSKLNLMENKNIPGVWLCQLHGLLTDAFVIPDTNVRPDGIFFLKPLPHSTKKSIPVISAFSLVAEVETNEKQPLKALNMFMTTGLENFSKTKTGKKNDNYKSIDMPIVNKYLRWLVCPNMEFYENHLDYFKTNMYKLNNATAEKDIFTPFQEQCGLFVTDKQSNRILDCIEQYSAHTYYKHMKQVYNDVFSNN